MPKRELRSLNSINFSSAKRPAHHAIRDLLTDGIEPHDLQSLAVHPRKVKDVRQWLLNALERRPGYRVLVLSGPSGVGKTATMDVLAREMDFELVRYESPQSQLQHIEATATTTHLSEFIERSVVSGSADEKQRVIFVEDLSTLVSSASIHAFRASLAYQLQSPRSVHPLVLVMSDASLEDQPFNAYSLCGSGLLSHAACTEITFNPVAYTIMKKALSRAHDIVNPHAKESSVLDTIAKTSNGDLRAALMTYDFYNKSEASGVDFIQSHVRDSSLFLFHMLGRILYAKRWGQDPQDDAESIKKGLTPLDGAPKLQVDDVEAEFLSKIDLLVPYIQHNAVQFTNTIHETAHVLDGLSLVDCMHPYDVPSHTLQFAVRSVLYNLPSPVPRNKQDLRKPRFFHARDELARNTALMHEIEQIVSPGDSAAGDAVPYTGRFANVHARLPRVLSGALWYLSHMSWQPKRDELLPDKHADAEAEDKPPLDTVFPPPPEHLLLGRVDEEDDFGVFDSLDDQDLVLMEDDIE